MKKIMLITLFLVFFVAIVFAVAGDLKDGLYKSKDKFIEVDVTVKDGEIEAIDIKKHASSDMYLTQLEPLVQNILDAQSTDVDSVTGATVSSNALKKAVNNCIKQAER